MPQPSLPPSITSLFDKTLVRVLILTAIAISSLFLHQQVQAQLGQPTIQCPNEEPIVVPNTEVRLITNPNARNPNTCIQPTTIFLHATNALSGLNGTYGWFNNVQENTQGVNSHFIIDVEGKILQTTRLYSSSVEFARTNDPYNNYSIGIEMEHHSMEFENGKSDVPAKQWQSTLDLVAFLMNQYNIPMGQEYDHLSPYCFNDVDPQIIAGGVYTHYQIGPDQGCNKHTDIGKEAFKEFRQDLATLTGQQGTTGSSTAAGGRMVPYDKYARPYSWPMSGKIMQPYGFTEAAQNLGQRYPGYYPLGNPNVVFSTTNHIEPPYNPTTDRYLNPNIDIEPDNEQASSRAVYATHAGWITYAGWAGPHKGYTIQIESDVEGDGQADLATRYMRLQAPEDGYFAPDIAEYYPDTTPVTNPTSQNERPLQIQTPPIQVIEAEQTNLHPSDSDRLTIVDDHNASLGQAVHFTGTGTANISFESDFPADKLIITARATESPLCVKEGAQISIRTIHQEIDAAVTQTTSSNIYRRLEIPVEELDGRQHSINIAFQNPGLYMCDRQLWIDTISYVVTDPTQPVVTTVSEVDIEAESLTVAPELAPDISVENDTESSQEAHFVFNKSGKIERQVELPQSNYISFRAKALTCDQEVFPILQVSLDNQPVISRSIQHSYWQDYSGEVTFPGSSSDQAPSGASPSPPPNNPDSDLPLSQHTLTVEYTNHPDEEDQSLFCEPTVYLDVLTFTNYEITQATSSPTSLIGKTKYVARDQLIGYVSSSRGQDLEWATHQEQNSLQFDDSEQHDQALEYFKSLVPNLNQTYLSYRIMYNNPNLTTFPPPNTTDRFINAKVDDPYIVETSDNTIAGSLKNIINYPGEDMFFFCAHRSTGNTVRCINQPNP